VIASTGDETEGETDRAVDSLRLLGHRQASLDTLIAMADCAGYKLTPTPQDKT
jgi:hypothetical protein